MRAARLLLAFLPRSSAPAGELGRWFTTDRYQPTAAVTRPCVPAAQVLTPHCLEKLRSYLLERSRLLTLAALGGVACATCGHRASSNDSAGIRAALSEAAGLRVKTFVWEPSRGLLGDFTVGRPVLFEAREEHDASSGKAPSGRPPHDIYRAFARTSPEGQLLDIHTIRNLTRTRKGDESGLSSTENVAVFLSESAGEPPSLSLLELDGERLAPLDSGGSRLSGWDGVQGALRHWIDTGSWHGLGRTDIIGSTPDDVLRVTVEGKRVELLARSGATSQRHDFELGEIPPAPTDGVQIIERHHEPIPWLHFLANVGRGIVGNGWVAWAEGRFFSLQDALKRAGHSLTAPAVESPQHRPALSPRPLAVGSTVTSWPPLPLHTERGKPGDGVWVPVESKLIPSETPSLFYRTVLHPDAERPYAELHLVAMDMRRLELGIAAGYEDPEPDFGPPGSGQIPDDRSLFPRVVATFNGAFKATHGRYGMKAEGRVLVAPRSGAATVTVDHEGRTGFGTWSGTTSADTLRAFRQNLDPLIADGEVNPAGRTVWGDQLYGSNVAVERSALCLHESGQVFYGWATEATGKSLAQGLAVAGCKYAVHLDMNPGHCSFSFTQIDSVNPLKARGEVLDPRMRVNPTRFVRWSPKDFFYVVQRAPQAIGQQKGTFVFSPAPGDGPPPQTVAAILLGRQVLGGIPVEVAKVDPSRFAWVVHPAPLDMGQYAGKEQLGLLPDQQSRVLSTWGLGHSTYGSPSGLALGTQVLLPLRRTFSSLVLEGGTIRLLPPGEPLTEAADRVVVQLPTMARDGELLSEARELGGKRARSAICFDQDGNLYIGRLHHDTIAPLIHELLALGCDLVAEMDRGSHSPLLVERAGTDTPPHLGHEQTVLYALSQEMKPKTYTF